MCSVVRWLDGMHTTSIRWPNALPASAESGSCHLFRRFQDLPLEERHTSAFSHMHTPGGTFHVSSFQGPLGASVPRAKPIISSQGIFALLGEVCSAEFNNQALQVMQLKRFRHEPFHAHLCSTL